MSSELAFVVYAVVAVASILSVLAWGVNHLWQTENIIAVAFLGGLTWPGTLPIAVISLGFSLLYRGVDHLRTRRELYLTRRAAVEREIQEWLR